MSNGRLAAIAWLLFAAAGGGVLRAAPPAPAAATRTSESAAAGTQADFDHFVDRLAADWMRANPQAATTQQYFSGAEQDALDGELSALDAQYGTPYGTDELAAYVVRARSGLERVRAFRRDRLSDVQRVSAAMLEWQLEDALSMAQFADQRFVFEQFRGLHVALVNFLSQIHPLRTPRDVDNYLARLARLAPVLDQGIEVARARAAKGLSLIHI